MKNYLLGNLDPTERSALEERILCDPEVYEQLLAAEKELIDQYLAGRLSKLEQHQFETHFLTTAERQKDLRFGRLAKERLNSTTRRRPYLFRFRKAQKKFYEMFGVKRHNN